MKHKPTLCWKLKTFTPRRHEEKKEVIVAIKPESSSFLWEACGSLILNRVLPHFRKPNFLILSGKMVKGRNKEKKKGGIQWEGAMYTAASKMPGWK